MSVVAPPIPDDSEILWKHSGASLSDGEPVSLWWGKIGRILYKLFMIGALVFWSLQFVGVIEDFRSDPDRVLSDLKSFLWPLIGYGILALLFVKFRHKFQAASTTKTAASGIPLWLTRKQLGFEPAQNININLISVDEIQSLSPDYSEGAPAISVRLSAETLTLISSEARSLLKSLYTLRPDLEPTS